MTAPARITQADMERAAKAAARSGFRRARILMDLNKGKIEVLLSNDESEQVSISDDNWDDEDDTPAEC